MSPLPGSPVTHLTPLPLAPDGCPILGVSPAIQRATGLAFRFAPTELPILLVGPTGSGKELFARQIHSWSARTGAFVDVNAGALPREMVESLLFGHRRGAFTGAAEATDGLLVAADRGTLFLDELGSLPVEGQAKLLRALETGEVRPLGETRNRAIRCRFVAAVQGDIDQRVRVGEFRLDLYQRLAGVVIRIPPLAERPEDIVPLARHFVGGQGGMITPPAEAVLAQYGWPGNVRELRAAVLRSLFLAGDRPIDSEVMREAIALSAPAEGPVPARANGMALEPLIGICRQHGWDVGRAAAALGIGRSTLYRRLRELGVNPLRWRNDAQLGESVDNWDGTRRDETA